MNAAKGKIYAIGDVHGCATELRALLEKLNPTAADTVVFLGDYVDRGPDARGVIDQVLALRSVCEVIALKGNHEAMFLDFLERPDSAGAGLFVLNGGSATLANYMQDDGSIEIPAEHLAFLRDLKLTYQTERFFFVHAGVPDIPLASLDEYDVEMALLWTRHPFLNSEYQWEKLVVHGHTPMRQVEVKENRINIDTGCVYGGMLSALELPAGKFHQVERGVEKPPVASDPQPNSQRLGIRFSGRLPLVVGKVGEKSVYSFETLNYNQFGLLMREIDLNCGFSVGDLITGRIGSGAGALQFKGRIVRQDGRSGQGVFGVTLESLEDAGEKADWA